MPRKQAEQDNEQPQRNQAVTDMQKRFAEEYCVDWNSTRAARRAGYSTRSARNAGYQNLKNLAVVSLIKEKQRKLTEQTTVTLEYVLSGLRTVAERCRQAVPVLDSNGNEVGLWKFDAAGANRALELLGKHIGAFEADNVQKGIQVAIMSNIEGLGATSIQEGGTQADGKLPETTGKPVKVLDIGSPEPVTVDELDQEDTVEPETCNDNNGLSKESNQE